MTTIDGGGPAVLDPPSAQPDQPGPGPKKRRRKLVLLILLLVVLAVVAAVFLWYLQTRKPLSQLPGLDTTKLPHYQTSAYDVRQPIGVAATASGDRVYVTQTDGPRTVLVLDNKGKKLGVLRPDSKTGPAHTPVYVAVNPLNDEVYVSDRATAAVYVYSPRGVYLRSFIPKGLKTKPWAPLGLAFSPGGELYVTDVTVPKHLIEVFSTDGTLKRTLGAEDGLKFPNGLAVDKHGNVFVADSNNGRLLVYGKDGKVRTTLGRGVGDGALGLPRGVALGDHDRLFIVDTSDHMVRVFKVSNPSSPAFLGSFGNEGQLDGTFRFPNGVAVDERGHVYVTDRDNNRLQLWSY